MKRAVSFGVAISAVRPTVAAKTKRTALAKSASATLVLGVAEPEIIFVVLWTDIRYPFAANQLFLLGV
jgi:hypothetical protein